MGRIFFLGGGGNADECVRRDLNSSLGGRKRSLRSDSISNAGEGFQSFIVQYRI